MLKIDDTMDKNTLKQSLERKKKNHGSYHKNWIINASSIPPFDIPDSKHTEFYSSI